jgi:hypothetical protein
LGAGFGARIRGELHDGYSGQASMNLYWYDVAGIAGVILILIAYLMLQLGRWGGIDLRYTLFNLAGALLIIVSLIYDFNLSAFLMEAAWVVISFIGIHRALTGKKET